jgi:hypothetical protein
MQKLDSRDWRAAIGIICVAVWSIISSKANTNTTFSTEKKYTPNLQGLIDE